MLEVPLLERGVVLLELYTRSSDQTRARVLGEQDAGKTLDIGQVKRDSAVKMHHNHVPRRRICPEPGGFEKDLYGVDHIVCVARVHSGAARAWAQFDEWLLLHLHRNIIYERGSVKCICARRVVFAV